jgi:hypothetical protein
MRTVPLLALTLAASACAAGYRDYVLTGVVAQGSPTGPWRSDMVHGAGVLIPALRIYTEADSGRFVLRVRAMPGCYRIVSGYPGHQRFIYDVALKKHAAVALDTMWLEPSAILESEPHRRATCTPADTTSPAMVDSSWHRAQGPRPAGRDSRAADG